MPLTRLAADAFGVVTIALVSLTAILGLLCIYRSVRFSLRIHRSGFLQLSYFNGPWVTRIALILVAILWGFGEVVRLSLLKGTDRLFTDLIWQKNVCKIYIVSNLGFAEPSMFLMLVFLLHASLQKRDSGALSPRWNRKTVSYVFFYCFPLFVTQLVLILVGPKMNSEEKGSMRTKMAKFFASTYKNGDDIVCTYPLMSTILVGLFYALLISYLSFVGTRLLSLVINKGLRLRVYLLILSVIIFAPLRVLLLGFSVLPHQGHIVYEALVFLAFLVLLFCIVVGIFMLVYFPVADSLAVGDLRRIEILEMPYDDYYYDGASLIANQSNHEMGTRRSSDASTKPGSMSFRAMIKDEPSAAGLDNGSVSSGSLRIVASAGPSQISGRPMIPLREFSPNES